MQGDKVSVCTLIYIGQTFSQQCGGDAMDRYVASYAPRLISSIASIADENGGVNIRLIRPGVIVNVQTANLHLYKILVLEANTGKAIVVGNGNFFNHPTVVKINGATIGGTCLKPLWIGVGMRIEFSLTSDIIVTTSPAMLVVAARDRALAGRLLSAQQLILSQKATSVC